MVERQLRGRGIWNERVLAAMLEIPPIASLSSACVSGSSNRPASLRASAANHPQSERSARCRRGGSSLECGHLEVERLTEPVSKPEMARSAGPEPPFTCTKTLRLPAAPSLPWSWEKKSGYRSGPTSADNSRPIAGGSQRQFRSHGGGNLRTGRAGRWEIDPRSRIPAS
jgi:hypothetical protein